MRESEAKKLKVGDRIEFFDEVTPNPDNGSLGTITQRDYARVQIEWDDGVVCSYPHTLAMAIRKVEKSR